MHGHLLGAAGALECVLSLLAMQHEVALPTMHLQQPIPIAIWTTSPTWRATALRRR